MGDWRKAAKKLMTGKWLKFDAENPAWTVTFQGEPQVVEKTAQQGPNAGEVYQQMSFPVEVNGEPKLLEPNRSLLAYIMDEDSTEDIMGRTFLIKCLDLKGKRQWKMIEQGRGVTSQSWAGEKKPQAEAEEPEKPKKKPRAAQDKDKEKFKAEIAKKTAERKDQEEKDREWTDEDQAKSEEKAASYADNETLSD